MNVRTEQRPIDASLDHEFDVLSRIELFQHLQSVKLKRLIFVSQRYHLEPGEYLFRQGDPMDRVFGVVDGDLSVTLESANGEIVVARQGPGDLVGEMAVISGEPRSASIRANATCEVIGFEKELFINTVIHDPGTALKMMQLLADRLSNQNSLFAEISGRKFIL